MKNCMATICIESDIDNNDAIQDVVTKMKSICGGRVFSISQFAGEPKSYSNYCSECKFWLRCN